MVSDWRYKVLDIPDSTTVEIITNNVKGMSAKTGDVPIETTLHGRLGGGLYAYVYPLPVKHLEIITEDFHYEEGEIWTVLKHKPKNESLLNPFTAVDVSTRVEGSIVTELSKTEGKELIDRVIADY